MTYLASAHVSPGPGHGHGRYDVRVAHEEPLPTRAPVVRRDVRAQRVHQVHAVRVHDQTIGRVAVEADQRLQLQVLHADLGFHCSYSEKLVKLEYCDNLCVRVLTVRSNRNIETKHCNN